jgi:imidazole glycerol-phosphate synthase subunit HisH
MIKNNKKVLVIDYQLNNIFSVTRALSNVGITPTVTSNFNDIPDADALVLPGVGAFGDAMSNLEKLNMINPILDFVDSGKPFFAICLGLQLLFSESEEFGVHKGLDIVSGKVVKFPNMANGHKLKVPQITWNHINKPSYNNINWSDTPFKYVNSGEYMYFVHSFYVSPEDKNIVLSTTDYCETSYCSSILSNNIFATQFHPEKSGEKGLEIYKAWSETI